MAVCVSQGMCVRANVCDVELSCEQFVLCLHVCCFCLGSDTLDVFYWFRCGTHFQAGQGGHRQLLFSFPVSFDSECVTTNCNVTRLWLLILLISFIFKSIIQKSARPTGIPDHIQPGKVPSARRRGAPRQPEGRAGSMPHAVRVRLQSDSEA